MINIKLTNIKNTIHYTTIQTVTTTIHTLIIIITLTDSYSTDTVVVHKYKYSILDLPSAITRLIRSL